MRSVKIEEQECDSLGDKQDDEVRKTMTSAMLGLDYILIIILNMQAEILSKLLSYMTATEEKIEGLL